MTTVTSTDLKNDTRQVIQKTLKNGAVTIMRYGEPTVVMVRYEDWIATSNSNASKQIIPDISDLLVNDQTITDSATYFRHQRDDK